MSEEFLKECSFVISGNPISKSNHSLVNRQGKKILPSNSPYAAYEKLIMESIIYKYKHKRFESKVICVLNVFFKHKERHSDLANMTKSICDGIEKSGVVTNDRHMITFYLTEDYDYDNPRVEVLMYDAISFKPVFKIENRSEEEIEALIEDKLKSSKKKAKAKKASDSAKKKDILCSNCGKVMTKAFGKQISGTKDFICNKCIVLNLR